MRAPYSKEQDDQLFDDGSVLTQLFRINNIDDQHSVDPKAPSEIDNHAQSGNLGEILDTEYGEVVVLQVTSSSMFRVQFHLQNVPIKAVIDTAAEVTIISDKLYQNLPEKPSVIRKVKMNTAGRDLSMTGCVCGPFSLILGGLNFFENVYVAPIQDDMLLGLDFMRKHKVLVNIPEEHISMGDIVIPMVKLDGSIKVAEVKVCKTTVVPPNTIVNVQCVLGESLPSFVMEQSENSRVVKPPRGRCTLWCLLSTSQIVM